MLEKNISELALTATPQILDSLGMANLSPSICGVIKTLGCKDQIVLESAIKELGPNYANICDRYMSLLNDTIQVYTQSNCGDYTLIIGEVLQSPSSPLEEKIRHVAALKNAQHVQQIEMMNAKANQVSKIMDAAAEPVRAAQASKIAGDVRKIDKHHQRVLRKKNKEDAKVERRRIKEAAKTERRKAKELTKIEKEKLKIEKEKLKIEKEKAKHKS